MTDFASVVADIRYFADISAEISEILIHASEGREKREERGETIKEGRERIKGREERRVSYVSRGCHVST